MSLKSLVRGWGRAALRHATVLRLTGRCAGAERPDSEVSTRPLTPTPAARLDLIPFEAFVRMPGLSPSTLSAWWFQSVECMEALNTWVGGLEMLNIRCVGLAGNYTKKGHQVTWTLLGKLIIPRHHKPPVR